MVARKSRKRLKPHPRLFADRESLEKLTVKPRHPFLAAAWEHIAERAGKYVRSAEFEFDVSRHNSFLTRARIMQGRVCVLLGRWLQTGDERFRRAVLEHVRAMGEWECWSWITWRESDCRPNAIFDLSYGENSFTLALVYDWLHDTFSAEERKLVLRIARDRALRPFLANTGKKDPAWWSTRSRSNSNWATVCAGGAGILALATCEDLRESPEARRRAERVVKPFFEHLRETGGGWPEGVGYWNYGMSYGFRYLLSHEAATGKQHPLLRIPEVRKTLRFPLDFCPNGVPSSFGDVNMWAPAPFHYAVASRLGMSDLLASLDEFVSERCIGYGRRDMATEFLLMHPGRASRRRGGTESPANRIYKGLDWGILADRMPSPRLYMSVRGGTTEVPHGHMDLMSYQVVCGDEALIRNLGVGEYLDTTFGPRRYELFETTPPAKNTLLINGVGITRPSTVRTGAVRGRGITGIRIDATAAMGAMRDGPVTRFCGRLYLLLRKRAFLIVDRCDLTRFGRVESRLHTHANAALARAGAKLKGERESLSLSYACNVPATLHDAISAPTTPGPGAKMLRWCTDQLHGTIIMATLILPGRQKAAVKIEETKSGARIAISGALKMDVKVDRNLRLR